MGCRAMGSREEWNSSGAGMIVTKQGQFFFISSEGEFGYLGLIMVYDGLGFIGCEWMNRTGIINSFLGAQ